MPTPCVKRRRRFVSAILPAAILMTLAGWIGASPADAKRDIRVLHEISDLEDRRSLGDGKLAAFLGDRDADTRQAAARAFGRIGYEEGLGPLNEALADSDENVRIEVIFALGQIGDPDSRDALRRVASSNVSIAERDEAVRALGKLGGEGAAEALLPFLADPSETIRADAALALAGTADSVAAENLRPLLNDGEPRVRASAAWAAGRLKARTLAPELRPLLNDSDPDVRLAATKSVGQIEDLESIGPLSLLAHDPDWRVRVNVVTSLGQMKTLDALPGISILSKDEDSNVRTAAAASLLDIPYHYKKDDVMFTLRSDDVTQVVAALMQPMAQGLENQDEALPEHWLANGDSSLAVVLAAYQSFADASRLMPDWSPIKQWRGGASFYMRGRMQNHEAPLAERIVAAYNVGAFDAAWHRKHLLEVLSQVHWAVTAAAIHSLGEMSPNDTTSYIRHKEETPGILAQVLERDPDVAKEVDIRLAVAEALGNFDRDDAREMLHDLAANDPNHRVRATAADALEKLGDPRPEVEPAGPLPGDAEPLDDDYLKMRPGKLRATLVTSKGDVVIELFPRDAPHTVQSFVQLAEKGFYDGLAFHRVVPNFVIQGGCPIGNGWGHPGYELRCEYNPRRYERGSVGMAHAGKDTGGSQFFVTHSAQPHLDGRYTVFGQVIEGMDVVDAIRVEDVIETVKIKRKLF